MSFKGFLFLALAAICSVERNDLSNFGKGPRNISVTLFEIGPLIKEEMSFKGFSIFSSGGHFVQWSGKGSPKEYFSQIILKSVHWSRRRCHLKVFLHLLDKRRKLFLYYIIFI